MNCNLQRLDGPVRGNGKIIQELESVFRGSGWNVIKVIWGREWDELLARDVDGVLVNKMNETTDGESQRLTIADGAYIREHFFGPDPRLRKLVEHLSDADLMKLRRGGHDYRKVYAAYHEAVAPHGGADGDPRSDREGLGARTERRGAQHHAPGEEALVRGAQGVPRSPGAADHRPAARSDPPYYHPGMDSAEVRYMLERRRALGGVVPKRVVRGKPLAVPGDAAFAEFPKGSGKAAASTTMAFTRLLRNLLRDEGLGTRVVPIIPDEARTFGMDPLFKEVGIYSSIGQKYEPVDAETLLPYREATNGQVLEEGITEAGSMASFTAAGTSYATHAEPMLPFYIFYSMFGFQRTMDQIWAFGDARGRGFLLGATAGRTTLNGEGLQHEDGHSHLLATAVPNIRAYDPAFAYETAVIVRDGIRRMFVENQDVFYYLTLYNENYPMPPMPEGVEDGILRGIYLFRKGEEGRRRVTLLGSGPILHAGAANAGDPAGEVRRLGRRLQRHELPAAAERGAGGRALEPAASDGDRKDPVRGAGARRSDAHHRRERLHEGGPRSDLALDVAALRPAGNGRLRTQRHARGATPSFRGRRGEHRRRVAQRARAVRAVLAKGRREGDRGSRYRSEQTGAAHRVELRR